MSTPRDLRLLAERVAREAGALTLALRASARQTPDTKHDVGDLVTLADRAAEQLIVASISQFRPDDGIIGEEGTNRPSRSGISWVIDPIDGTTNYVKDMPGYSISIAARDGDTALAGVVYDPNADECFAAHRGGGARLNGQPIRCSELQDLNAAVIGTGFGYAPTRRREQAQLLVHLAPRIANIRRLGSAALDLAYVACGRTDGFYESGLNDWDLAAGALIAQEAGALVTDLDGNAASTALALAANPTIHAALGAELRTAYAGLSAA